MATATAEHRDSTPAPGSTLAPAKPGEYHVARPGGVCAVSGRAIEPGEKMMAAVRETPTGLERLDVVPEQWESFDKAGLLAFWQTRMPRAEEKKKTFVDDAALCTVFEKLAETTEPVKQHFRFVLGLILMRKRLIAYESTRRETTADGSREVWVVRMRGRDERLELIDPRLNAEQVIHVSQQLGQILNEEL